MDKNAIKKFAVWARTELITRVSLKGVEYGITKESEQWITGNEQWTADSINGKVLTKTEKEQRRACLEKIKDKGYEQVMEEVAYTWFNRFSALRFMEVNGYLPSRVRVFTDGENNFKPQIITEAIHLNLDGLDIEKVYKLKEDEKTEELYKYLLIVQCNALSKILPGMFQKISDYTELLLPDNLLRDGSVIQKMIELIPEDDWRDAVQIIGWLYQYYNSEKKDDVFAALKKNVKITKENIPAATQLFTPDWIVRYMVENSLGRLWLEGHPDAKEQLLPTEEEQSAYAVGNRDPEDTKWHYYLEEAEQEPEVQAQLAEIRKEYAALTPERLKVIDPCSGSGHILAYMFDVLMKIYEFYGYTTREAVASIVENNIYGLDIDDRAAQLAYFAVMMKARQYDHRFFSRKDEYGNPKVLQPHVYAIVESGHTDKNGKKHKDYDEHALEYFCNGDAKLKAAMDTIISELHDAKEYGSILTVTPQDWSVLYGRFAEIAEDIHMYQNTVLKKLLPLVQVAEALAQKYDVVTTNPPYMGNNGFSAKMSDYAKKYYNEVKTDLFAIFMIRCKQFTKINGFQSMITQHSWMTLSSYEWLRIQMNQMTITDMAHLGTRAFDEISGEMVATTAFNFRNSYSPKYCAKFQRLVDYAGEEAKQKAFLALKDVHEAKQNSFEKVPGTPYAYWASENVAKAFEIGTDITNYVDTFQGIITGDNDKFLRYWHEVNSNKIPFHATNMESVDLSMKYWIPYNKGGEFRKWYGVQDYVVYWKNGPDDKTRGKKGFSNYYLRKYVAWSYTISNSIATRIYPEGFLWDVRGSGIMDKSNMLLYLEGLISSKVGITLFKVNNSTLSCQVENIVKLPIIVDESKKGNIEYLVQANNNASQSEWDSFEISWDFKCHPLLQYAAFTPQMVAKEEANGYLTENGIADAYRHWEQACNERFNQLKSNEEELNRIFIDIYGLQDELTPEVEDKDVTVRKADLGRDIRSFISYAVGCMFGRYSLDVDGLVYAGGNFDSKYCRWIRQFGDKATEEIDENGNLIHGGWAGCTSWKYDGIRKDGKWISASFAPDTDNIIPICDDEYFEDDIVGLFVEFVKKVYGAETLDENLKFIAGALSGKGQPKDVIRNYFLNDFYADHCKIYQKRPIYWLFDSGKKNGFKALIYMHRYQPDTIARIRTDYVHEQQARYRTAIADLEQRIVNASTGERVKLNKKLTALQAQDTEIRTYEEKIHHLADQMISIDLDDGVKKNYAIFQDVLAKIK